MTPVPITIAVEGLTDIPVASRLLAACGHSLGAVHDCRGKSQLDARLHAYNLAAQHSPWLVMRDLDRDSICAPTLVGLLLPNPVPKMIFRVAVHDMEAWLLADRAAMAHALRVRESAIPIDPDNLVSAKVALVNIARGSRSPSIRRDLVPWVGSPAKVGRGYTMFVQDFAQTTWDPDRAAANSDSLARALRALRSL